MATITAVFRDRLTTDVGQFAEFPFFGRERVRSADQFDFIGLHLVGSDGELTGFQQAFDLFRGQDLAEHRSDELIQSGFVNSSHFVSGGGLEARWFSVQFQQECCDIGSGIDCRISRSFRFQIQVRHLGAGMVAFGFTDPGIKPFEACFAGFQLGVDL